MRLSIRKWRIDDKSNLAINLNNPKAWNITNRIKLVHVLLMTMELREAYVELMIELEEIRLKEKYGK